MGFKQKLEETLWDLSLRKPAIGWLDTEYVVSPWDMEFSFNILDDSSESREFVLRNLRMGDEENLIRFGLNLGSRSRELFCPYPWEDRVKLREAVISAVSNSVRRVDASYFIFEGENPVGHFFLWKAGGNQHSGTYGVQVPELGIAFADSIQGNGFGTLGVKVLQEVAKEIGSDAIELTTAMENDGGYHLYENSGFVYTGDIVNPLEVDVTSAVSGDAEASRFRTERQMVFVVDPTNEMKVLDYLRLKREESERWSE